MDIHPGDGARVLAELRNQYAIMEKETLRAA
jgi:hypothetical protein